MANSERSISFATRKRESRNLCQKPKLNANLAMAVGARSGWQSRQSTNCGLGFAERALRFRTLSKSFPATASSAPFSFSGFKRFGLYNDMLKSVPEECAIPLSHPALYFHAVFCNSRDKQESTIIYREPPWKLLWLCLCSKLAYECCIHIAARRCKRAKLVTNWSTLSLVPAGSFAFISHPETPKWA